MQKQSETATITFDRIPQVKYAINIIHDENSNGKIDMGFLLPKEGIGFSNFTKFNIRNRPSFTKASFELNIDIRLTYRRSTCNFYMLQIPILNKKSLFYKLQHIDMPISGGNILG